MMRRSFGWVLLWIFVAGLGWARSPFFPAVGARQRGLGAISTTVRGDAASLFGNPALLVDLREPTLLVDATQSAVAAAVPLGRFGTLGAGILDLAGTDRFLFNEPWNPIGTFETDRNRATASYALVLHRRLRVGIGVDGWKRPEGAWERGLSVGLLAFPSRLVQIGIEGHRLPDGSWEGRTGFLFRPDRRLQLHAEFARREVGFGFESVWHYVTLRAGLWTRTRSDDPTFVSLGGSTGIGRGVQLHYSYQFDATDFMAGTHRISFDVPLWNPGGREGRRTASNDDPAEWESLPRETGRQAKRPTPVTSAVPTSAKPESQAEPEVETISGPRVQRRLLPVPPVDGTPEPSPSVVPAPVSPPQEPESDATPPRPEPPTSPAPTTEPPTPAIERPIPRRIISAAIDRQLDIPPEVNGSLRRLIEHHAEKYGIEIPLILAMIRAESGFNPRAISPSKAVGLLQLLPGTASDMGIPLRKKDILNPKKDGRFDPLMNVDAGIRYFAYLMNRFDWNPVLALSAYNAGIAHVLNDDIPRKRETERHVGKVMNYYYQYKNDPTALEEAWQRVEAITSRN